MEMPVTAADARAMPWARLACAFQHAWATHHGVVASLERQRQVHVALFDLTQWMGWLPDALLLLDGAEMERACRKRRSTDREFLSLAYALHRVFLGTVLGLQPDRVPLGRDARGSPTLAGLSVSTSLSHADQFLALAVCDRGPTGVDIEPIGRAASLPEIAEVVCHPHEAADLHGVGHDVLAQSLLALWVRKEALLKAAGLGLAREMRTFRAPEGTTLPLHDPHGPDIRLSMLDAGPRVIGAVASPPGVVLRSSWLTPSPAMC